MQIRIKVVLFAILIAGLPRFSFGVNEYDTSDNMFNYSLVYVEKRCNKVPLRIKKGLRLALSESYKGLAVIKQDTKKGITMLSQSNNTLSASLYFRDQSTCEEALARMP